MKRIFKTALLIFTAFLMCICLAACGSGDDSGGGLVAGPLEGATGSSDHVAAPKSDNVLMPAGEMRKLVKDKYEYKAFTKVEFCETIDEAPADAIDLSENADGSVKGWVLDNCFYIAGEGGVAANADSSELFWGFECVTEFNFNDCFDTSRVERFFGMFANCKSVDVLDISSFDFSNAEDMGHMFYEAKINKIIFGDVDASKVTSMRSMFQEFETENNIDFSKFKTGKVKDMDLMFCNSNFKNIDLTPLEGNSVFEISYMFAGCKELETVKLGALDTSKVFDTSCMFEYCIALKELDLTKQDFSNACVMHDMFADCKNLTRLELGGFKTGALSNVLNVFMGCSSLTELDVSLMDTSNLYYMTNIFGGCASLKSVDISMWNTQNAEDFSYMFYGCEMLESVNLGSINVKKVRNYEGMFYGCKSLTEIDLTGLEIGRANFESAFSGCAKLNSLGEDFEFPEGCKLWKAFLGSPLNERYGEKDTKK